MQTWEYKVAYTLPNMFVCDLQTPEAQEAARRQAEEERLAKLQAWKRDLLLKKKGEL